LRIVFFGTPEFAIPSLRALLNSGHEVLLVVTQPDRQSGRGRRITPSPVKIEAQKQGVQVVQPQKVKDAEFIKQLNTLKPSAIVVVAYGQILPPEIIHLPEFGCINVHASLLPKYRGAAPVNWAIINGESKTGVTTMLMDEGMDTGPVLLQEEVEIKADDTAGSLTQRLSMVGAEVLMKTLKGLKKNNLKPRLQDGEVSYAPILRKADGLIQWTKPAWELCNFIRGTNPWPGAYSSLEGERVKILKAIALDGKGEAGVIIKATKDELLVGTGEGVISMQEIQLSGKPVMGIKAFLQGRRLTEGMRFYEKPVD